MMLAVAQLAPRVGLRSACQAFALNRGFVYRDRARRSVTASRRAPQVRPRPPLALSSAEQDLLLGLLDSERFADVAPATVFATLLDEGRYHGSTSSCHGPGRPSAQQLAEQRDPLSSAQSRQKSQVVRAVGSEDRLPSRSAFSM